MKIAGFFIIAFFFCINLANASEPAVSSEQITPLQNKPVRNKKMERWLHRHRETSEMLGNLPVNEQDTSINNAPDHFD